jgi:prepilin-type N-terminal cleavage/methylation domain-containing protein
MKSNEFSSRLTPHPSPLPAERGEGVDAPHPSPLPNRGQGGFTMIEMIGVLALVAILAAVMMPSVIKQVDQAAWTRETSDLNELAQALERSVVRAKTVPNVAGIPAAIANELAMPLNGITTNPRGRARAFLMDPNMRINGLKPSNESALGTLPYVQDEDGASAPISARVLIVSSLMDALPVTSGVPTTQAAFDNIWDAGENEVPAGWTWTGRGEDLRIRRINLGPKFHRLMLIDRDSNTVDPYYLPPLFSIDTTDLEPVPAGAAGYNAFYLDGTMVGLHASEGALHARHVLNNDISFVFEKGLWRGWIGPGTPTLNVSDEFLEEALAFLGSDWNLKSNKGASQNGVLVAMYVFMFNYTLWAELCPHFSRHGAVGGQNLQQVPEYAILEALAGAAPGDGILTGASKDLLSTTGK